MGSTPRFAKDRVIQASHPFRSARADESSHPFYDSPGPPTRSWPDATPRPRTAPPTKEPWRPRAGPPPPWSTSLKVEVPHTPVTHGYADESPYAAHAALPESIGTSTVDPHTHRLQILSDTPLAKEMNGRLEVARQALVYARREGNMRSMREAADEFLRAERDQVRPARADRARTLNLTRSLTGTLGLTPTLTFTLFRCRTSWTRTASSHTTSPSPRRSGGGCRPLPQTRSLAMAPTLVLALALTLP